MPDVGASILARLKNKAKETGMVYQQCLQLFIQEEFLRRLASSPYAENLVLKGGLFIYTLTNFEGRATVDVDFLLRRMDANMEHVSAVIREITSTSTANDAVSFTVGPMEQIAAHRRYRGLSVQVIGHIKNVRVPINIDMGIGDVIVPKAEERTIRPQLDDFVAPTVYTYSLESTIAEKFDAILQRFELTSRMKDFYDIFYLAHRFDFDGRKLQEAVAQTLQNRGTSYEQDSFQRVLALVGDDDIQVRWRRFLRTLRQPGLEFITVMETIEIFLGPVFQAILDEDEWLRAWRCQDTLWS